MFNGFCQISKLMRKMGKLIFDGEYKYFCTWRVEKLQIYPNLCVSLNRLNLKILYSENLSKKSSLALWLKDVI